MDGNSTHRSAMRSVTTTLTHPSGFHPVTQTCSNTPFTRETVYQFNVLKDGTAIVLCRVRGDLECAHDLIGDHPDTLSYTMSEGSDGEGLAYVHTTPPEPVADLIELSQRHEVVFDFPLTGVREDAIRATVIGESNDVLQRAIADVPEEIDVTVERIGEYPSETGDLSSVLTARQREILEIAIDLGYYDVPRQATHEDIAEHTDVSASAVSEHMQKIEARTFASLAG